MKKKKTLLFTLLTALLIGFSASLFAPGIGIMSSQAASIFDLSAFFGLKTEGETLPGQVVSSSYSQLDPTSLSLAWDAVVGAEGYDILLSHNGSNTSYSSTSPEISINSLTPGASYSYQVRYKQTVNGTLCYSAYSQIFTAYTSVYKVTGVTVVSTGASVSEANVGLTWDTQGEASYEIYYKTKTSTDYTLAGTSTTGSYTVSGLSFLTNYDISVRAYGVSTDNAGPMSDPVSVLTGPSSVGNLQVASSTTSELILTWDPALTATAYNIYRSVNGGEYSLYTTTTTNSLTDQGLTPGTVYCYKVAVWNGDFQMEGPLSDELRGVTNPNKVVGLSITGNGSSFISLAWTLEPSATGYLIYRYDSTSDYTLIGTTTATTYTDSTVAAGKNYRYKVCAYADTNAHIGEYSDYVRISTLPAQPILQAKAGYGKLRLHWAAVSGAAGYYVYQLQADGTYLLLNTLEGKTNTAIVYSNLTVGTTYYYKVYSYRVTLDQTFVSEEPIAIGVTPIATIKTSTTAYLYKTKAKLKKSAAWKVAIVKSAANYNKCYTIPGLTTTNVAGFGSTNMCPQAMCVAGKYMLITAYDRDAEENSVIYVLGKSTRKLKTVIVLENQTHAGGMCYDGTNIWITQGKTLCSIPYSSVDSAAKRKAAYAEISFTNVCTLKSKGSFATYYNGKIWAGSYESSAKGVLYSYTAKTDANDKITLTAAKKLTIPCAVQGIAFASGSKLLLSRAYGSIHQLDIYKPVSTGSRSMKLGTRIKYVSLPYLSQGIDIYKGSLYMNFESAVSPKAIDHMDRVIALNLKKVLKVTKKK